MVNGHNDGALSATVIDVEPTPYQVAAQRKVDEANAELALALKGEVEAHGLESYTRSLDVGRLEPVKPLLMRSDGEPLMYQGKLNTIYGSPASGKSWIALLAIQEVLIQGGRAAYWDFEDSVSTFVNRFKVIASDALNFQDDLRYLQGDVTESTVAVAELQTWLTTGDGPGLLVIDSAESAGCPSDGASVVKWFETHVTPYTSVGAAVLVIDHVPKSKIDRPRGAIGSQHKLARVDGVALAISGSPWSKRFGGKIFIRNEKDRVGDLPVGNGKIAAVVEGFYNRNGVLEYNIVPPDDTEDEPNIAESILQALADNRDAGIRGAVQMRSAVKAKGQAVDEALQILIDTDLISRVKDGQAFKFDITDAGLIALNRKTE